VVKRNQELKNVIASRDIQASQAAANAAAARYEQAVAQLGQVQAALAQSRAKLDQAKAGLAQAQAQLSQQQANLDHSIITSPIDGVVVSRDVNVGQTVAASLSAPTLFTIAQDLTQMQVIANIDQADIGLVEQAKGVGFTVDAFPSEEFKGTIQQMRLNPQNVQNVVTYNVVIDVANPEQKLKPGMTANLTVTIDERNDVLKVPNSALRFVPQTADGQQTRAGGNSNGQRRQRQSTDGASNGANAAANAGAASQQPNGAAAQADGAATNQQNGARAQFARPTEPVLPGQTRRVWVMGTDGKLQTRRIKVGLTDGSATEVVEGDLREGDVVVTGQNVTASSSTSSTQRGGQSSAPGFGGAPRVGGAGGGRGR